MGCMCARAADLRSVLKLARALLQHFSQLRQARRDQARGFAHLERLRRIHHIVRREPVMKPTRGFRIVDGFAHDQRESDDVKARRASTL